MWPQRLCCGLVLFQDETKTGAISPKASGAAAENPAFVFSFAFAVAFSCGEPTTWRRLSSVCMVPVSPFTLQARTLEAFTVLCAIRPVWGGALVLNVGLDTSGCAVALACNAAGAVCLTLEPQSERLRASLRNGVSDFAVNTLDEALRAIKNEVRQKRPLSVGLEGSPAQLMDELLDRGVAPQIFAAPDTYPEHAARFASTGARPLSFHSSEAAAMTVQLVSQPATAWTLLTFAFNTGRELREFDARMLALLGPADNLRRQWLNAAGRLFPRDRTRSFWLTEENRQALEIHTALPVPSSESS